MMNKHLGNVTLRSIKETEQDREFLFSVFASSRIEEIAMTGWNEEEVESFLRMQFRFQDIQYRQNYPDASFNIILVNDSPAGRFYIYRGPKTIYVIELALLPEFQRQGIGNHIINELLQESDNIGLPVKLQVEQSNPIRTYYQRLGFHDKGLTGLYHHMERRPVPFDQ